ncbi:MAG: FAD binding domain-containing protein [Alphaproteobacteria bacterium]
MQTIYASHAAIPPFRLLRPRRALEAAAAKADLGAEAHYLAGGVDLVPALRAGRPVSALVVLAGLESFDAIERASGTLRLGAGLSYAEVAASAEIRASVPDFAAAFAGVANVRVRHVATLGGNVMSRNPVYDLLPALLALDARLVFLDRQGREEAVDGRDGHLPGGLLTRIEIPLPAERRFLLERAYKPVISLAVAIERSGAKLAGRAALGCAHAWPVALPLDLGNARDFRALAAGAGEAALQFAARLPEPLGDLAASADYRRTLAGVLLRRALERLARG